MVVEKIKAKKNNPRRNSTSKHIKFEDNIFINPKDSLIKTTSQFLNKTNKTESSNNLKSESFKFKIQKANSGEINNFYDTITSNRQTEGFPKVISPRRDFKMLSMV
jgi:hypothetical protein